MARYTVLSTLALAALLMWRPADAGTPDGPTVKEIMGKANKPTGLYFNLAQDLKDDSPSWPDIQQQSKDLAKLVAALRQATPPKGDKDSWDRLTRAYADNARALEAAAGKMDPAAARAAHAKMGEPACMTCHKAHRPE